MMEMDRIAKGEMEENAARYGGLAVVLKYPKRDLDSYFERFAFEGPN